MWSQIRLPDHLTQHGEAGRGGLSGHHGPFLLWVFWADTCQTLPSETWIQVPGDPLCVEGRVGPTAPSLVLAHTPHKLEVLGEGTHKQELIVPIEQIEKQGLRV